MARAVFSLLNRVFPYAENIVIRAGGISTILNLRDRAVSLYVFADPNIERKTFKNIADKLSHYGIKKSGLLFDIGANIGTSTLVGSQNDNYTNLHAFEPVPANFEILKKNTVINNLEERITVRQMALSDRKGVAKISLNPNNHGDNRLFGKSEDRNSTWEKIDVPVDTLDNYLDENGIEAKDIALLWIDSQGHEGQIFVGAEKLLSHRSTPIFSEFWPEGLRASGNDELFLEMVEKHFSLFVDMKTGVEFPASKIRSEFARYDLACNDSDLLLIP